MLDEQGLSQKEAKKRLLKLGYNQITSQNEKGVIFKFLSKFTSPLIMMLILIALISYSLGENINSIIIILIALLSSVLSFVQEYHASKSAKKLSALVKITVKTIRDRQTINVPLKMIVPGDLVILIPGKMVPADLKIIKSQNLYINQAVLSGESFPVKKSENLEVQKTKSIYDISNLAFMGSSVTSGTGEALVLKTGRNTEFGRLSHDVGKISGQTAFEKGVNSFAWLMIKFTLILVFFIFIANAILKGNIIESLLFSLAVAVGLTPEMLPMIVTINLSYGAINMARKKVIVKELGAIQNFGAMDILCTDKTGTLTLNEIVLVKHCDFEGKENQEILRLAYLNSYFQSGLENLLDQAIISHKKFDLLNFKKINEIPFDFTRRLLSVVVENQDKIQIVTKGAPEAVLKNSKQYLKNGQINDLSEEVRRRLKKMYDNFSRDGFRVLAIAYKDVGLKKEYFPTDEKDLIFAGFVAFLDPPKNSAQKAVERLEKANIKLKVLSGDNELITQKICSEVDIEPEGILNGESIDQLDDPGLQQAVEKNNIFTRLSPIQKERVVEAMRRNQHIVGFLGDGLNDAPALKAADVGISVDNAADITKDVAEIILLEKKLSILSDCVFEGRRTFANIIKYIKMGASSNFGNMLSMTGASVFLPILPMLPAQILLNNFLYDATQVALPSDSVDEDYLLQPRPWNINFIKKFMLILGPVSSIFDFATFAIMWYVFHASSELFHTGWFVESLFTQVLVVYIIRTNKIPFIQSRPSRALIWTTLGILLLAAIIPYTPLTRFLGFTPLPLTFFLILMIMVVLYLILAQIVKNWFIKKFGFE